MKRALVLIVLSLFVSAIGAQVLEEVVSGQDESTSMTRQMSEHRNSANEDTQEERH